MNHTEDPGRLAVRSVSFSLSAAQLDVFEFLRRANSFANRSTYFLNVLMPSNGRNRKIMKHFR